MAIQKYGKDGYGQIELNQVAWRRDGRIEAQCRLDATDFATDVAENGMLLAVDARARKLYKATATLAATLPIVINYSTEHLYDERLAGGLKYFCLKATDDFLPRCGYPAVGDKFTTNCIAYSDAVFDDDEDLEDAVAAIGTTPLYAGLSAGTAGYWEISATAPLIGPIARVIEKTTMPDGQFAVKLQIFKVV